MRLPAPLLVVAVAAIAVVVVAVSIGVSVVVAMRSRWRRSSLPVGVGVALLFARARRAVAAVARWRGGRRSELWLQIERRALGAREKGLQPYECARRQRQYAHEEHEQHQSGAGPQRRVQIELTLRCAPHNWCREGGLDGRVPHRRERVSARRCMHQQLQREGECEGEAEEEAQPERIVHGGGGGRAVQGNLEGDADEEHGKPVKAHGAEGDEAQNLVAEERRVETRRGGCCGRNKRGER